MDFQRYKQQQKNMFLVKREANVHSTVMLKGNLNVNVLMCAQSNLSQINVVKYCGLVFRDEIDL